MYNFNEHIEKHLLNEYGGSEKKRTVILDDGNKYLLKFPDPIREVGRSISYINNAISEYIGCKIAKSLGLPVQEVILGEYTDKESGKTKLACACKDLRALGETMHEIGRIELEDLDTESKVTFAETEKIISRLDGLDTESSTNFFYDMFVFDALTGNTDRHNGNWAVLSNENGDVRICPIYDCGSCLSPLLSDEDIGNSNLQNTALSVYSVIVDENGKRICYQDCLLEGKNQRVNEALLRIFPRINLPEIEDIIDSTPGISDTRKAFYKQLIEIRYEKQFIPALENLTSRKIANVSCAEVDLYDFFKRNIRPLQDSPLFQRQVVLIEGRLQDVMRISQRKALCFSDDGKIAVISLRSNNKETENSIKTLKYLGLFEKMPEQETNTLTVNKNNLEINEENSNDNYELD